MSSLLDYAAKRCLTAAGMLIYQKQVLLIKHKKLGAWLCPGGHVDRDELPHQAAEREFAEETGLQVVAFDPYYQYQGKDSEYYPSPIETNLHWVCLENYRRRIKSPDNYRPVKTWAKGCEQHLGLVYLLKPAHQELLKLNPNRSEVDEIGWFSLKEVDRLEASPDIKQQIKHGFAIMAALKTSR